MRLGLSIFFALAFGVWAPVHAQTLSALEIVERLRGGGHVIFFRHGETGRAGADRAQAVIGDCATQRNLDDRGRRQVAQLGVDFRALKIPVDKAYASDFCRGWQHAEAMFGPGGYEVTAKLSVPLSYPGVTDADRARSNADLSAFLAAVPRAGTNTVLVSHGVNVQMLTRYHPDVQGEAVIFKPDGAGGFQRLGSVLPEQWTEAARTLVRQN